MVNMGSRLPNNDSSSGHAIEQTRVSNTHYANHTVPVMPRSGVVAGMVAGHLKVRVNTDAEACLVWLQLVNFGATAEQNPGCKIAFGRRWGRGLLCV